MSRRADYWKAVFHPGRSLHGDYADEPFNLLHSRNSDSRLLFEWLTVIFKGQSFSAITNTPW